MIGGRQFWSFGEITMGKGMPRAPIEYRANRGWGLWVRCPPLSISLSPRRRREVGRGTPWARLRVKSQRWPVRPARLAAVLSRPHHDSVPASGIPI